jgi:hypothetical protein
MVMHYLSIIYRMLSVNVNNIIKSRILKEQASNEKPLQGTCK